MDDTRLEVEILFGEAKGFSLAEPQTDAQIDSEPVALLKTRTNGVDNLASPGLGLLLGGARGLTLFLTFMGLRSRRWSSTALPRIDDRRPQITSAVDSSTRESKAALKERKADASMSRRARSPTSGMMWFQTLLLIGPAVEGSSDRPAHQWSTM